LPRVPADLEAELSVLAQLADPLYPIRALDNVVPDDFYDHRNRTIFLAIKAGTVPDLPADDLDYLANAVRSAWPLHRASLESFLDCAARRRELFVLEARRLELLGVA
jgi:hypothetical protein